MDFVSRVSIQIFRHIQLTRELLGTWGRFWCSLPFTFETVRACMKASKAPEAGVKHCITTIWCDEGNEADIFSCLPGLQYFAEHAYTKADEVDVALVKLKFGEPRAAAWLI